MKAEKVPENPFNVYFLAHIQSEGKMKNKDTENVTECMENGTERIKD